MLVDINLLPKKELKNIALLFWGGILIVAVIIFLIVFYFALHAAKQELDSTSQKIRQVESAQAIEQAKQKSNTNAQDLQKLEAAVNWANDYPVKAVPILEQLTTLLPKYGYIRQFSCSETSAEATIQFDSNDEAAYYLKRLNDSKYFSDAVLTSIQTEEMQSGAASNSGTPAANTKAASETKTAAQSASNTRANPDGPKNSETSSGISSDANASTASSSNTDAAVSAGSSHILPVYLASYTMQLNKDALNAAEKEEKNN
ncbi:PilN domain-containing protein [Heyndrickxia acidiproducens]|jgi:Tfp pilus assembly protein PilN|uniref:PilN domain-containing protein n=1 Tax=Heyndrickxia acidiproducens TaxID=1121084 RepID=UPI00037C6DA9|nr:PilN domain-containing protein [Heyndrickxia acidiproducens]